ncbi:YtpI family protein [Cohnella abietis]|uniref:YtpI family protein n=1 Tax=Cohnella abietis TaxID=2507935 RepID=UPI00102E8CBF|nr:YtpI family protein [Cohnella abietis]
MLNTLQWVFGAIILVTCCLSAFNSFRARRSTEVRLRGLYTSRMNISMGLMLIFIAFFQMFMFSGSSVRVVIGSLFLLLGLFNLFAGIRNHSHFTRLLR